MPAAAGPQDFGHSTPRTAACPARANWTACDGQASTTLWAGADDSRGASLGRDSRPLRDSRTTSGQIAPPGRRGRRGGWELRSGPPIQSLKRTEARKARRRQFSGLGAPGRVPSQRSSRQELTSNNRTYEEQPQNISKTRFRHDFPPGAAARDFVVFGPPESGGGVNRGGGTRQSAFV